MLVSLCFLFVLDCIKRNEILSIPAFSFVGRIFWVLREHKWKPRAEWALEIEISYSWPVEPTKRRCKQTTMNSYPFQANKRFWWISLRALVPFSSSHFQSFSVLLIKEFAYRQHWSECKCAKNLFNINALLQLHAAHTWSGVFMCAACACALLIRCLVVSMFCSMSPLNSAGIKIYYIYRRAIPSKDRIYVNLLALECFFSSCPAISQESCYLNVLRQRQSGLR